MPFLGTGANGYLDSDAYYAVSSVCADLVAKEEELDNDFITTLELLKQLKNKGIELYMLNNDKLNNVVSKYKLNDIYEIIDDLKEIVDEDNVIFVSDKPINCNLKIIQTLDNDNLNSFLLILINNLGD